MLTRRFALATLLVVLCAGLSAQQAPDRSHPPAVGTAPALKLPAIEKRQLSNGLPVWIVEAHEVPIVQVDLVVLRGSANDPAGKFGLANFTASMLTNGAGARSALEVSDAVDFLGAELNTTSSTDEIAVRLHVPVSRLADALPIMADVAERPTFRTEEIDRLRQQRLTSLLQARDDPDTIASVALSRVLYGRSHRLGNLQMGTETTIKSFTAEDLHAFYAANVQPADSALVVVGDVTPDAVTPLLESSFGSWRAQGTLAPAATLPAVKEPAARAVYLVDKPGGSQSQVRIGWIGVPRSTPDYFPIRVMNTLLGEAYSSRLNMNLREQHGYTYGAFSTFDMRSVAGPFSALAGIQTDKTAPALTEFFKELTGIRQLAPDSDVTQAKNFMAFRFPQAFESTRDIAQELEILLVYHLPDDYYASYVQKVLAVTPADVQRVAQQYIQPDKFAVVVVGDLKAIQPGIEALNLGPVKVLTTQDIFD